MFGQGDGWFLLMPPGCCLMKSRNKHFAHTQGRGRHKNLEAIGPRSISEITQYRGDSLLLLELPFKAQKEYLCWMWL